MFMVLRVHPVHLMNVKLWPETKPDDLGCESGCTGIDRCLSYVPNLVQISHNPWDTRTFVSVVRLMTSRELTSGFIFWSFLPRSYCRDTSSHQMWYRCIHCGDAFYEIQDGRRRTSWICWGDIGPPTKAHARCVLTLKHL